MRWATRAHIHIDRAACAWLIRRFIDPDAEFVFVDVLGVYPKDAAAFDVPGAELSHHGGDCSFETILRRYELDDPVLWKIAEIVHEATSTTSAISRRRLRDWTWRCADFRWCATTSGCSKSPNRCSTGCTNSAAVPY